LDLIRRQQSLCLAAFDSGAASSAMGKLASTGFTTVEHEQCGGGAMSDFPPGSRKLLM